MKLPNTIASQQQVIDVWAKDHHVKIMKRYFDRNKPKKGDPLYPLYGQLIYNRATQKQKFITIPILTATEFCAMLAGNTVQQKHAYKILEQILNNMDEVEYFPGKGYQLKKQTAIA